MKKIVSGDAAIRAAIEYAQLTGQEACDISTRYADGLYEVRFATDWMHYDVYVDAADCEVLGFDCAPLSEPSMLCEQATASA